MRIYICSKVWSLSALESAGNLSICLLVCLGQSKVAMASVAAQLQRQAIRVAVALSNGIKSLLLLLLYYYRCCLLSGCCCCSFY